MNLLALQFARFVPLGLLLALATSTAGAALQEEQPSADIADAVSEPAVVEDADGTPAVADAMAVSDPDEPAGANSDGDTAATVERSDASTQDPAMAAREAAGKVGDAHTRLAAFVGDWDAKVSTWTEGVAEPMMSSGSASTQSVYDGRFVEMAFTGDFGGQAFQGTWVLGFDNVRQRYAGLWFDSMSTGLYTTMGEYDDASTTYTLRGTVADPLHAGELTDVRQAIRVVDNDEHVFESWETHGGEERKTMEIVYTRK